MKRHLNTLYVTTQDSWLFKDGECAALSVEGKTLGRIPLHTLESLICFGRVNCSQFLLQHCCELGITVSWFTESGRFMAAVNGPVSGNVLLRRDQYRFADSPEKTAALARSFVIGKLANTRTLLMRQARSTGEERLNEEARYIGHLMRRVESENDPEVIRGFEGDAAKHYFTVFASMISESIRDKMPFDGRSRRPPLDEVNCLLSFFYSILTNDVRGALEGVGLDPAVGFLHTIRPGRPSLALDMMEEFRAYLCDRLALTLINRKQLQKKDFIRSESGGVMLKENGRKEALKAWQERKNEEIEHPFIREKMTVGMLFHIQARLLARYIRGELDAYPPFAVR